VDRNFDRYFALQLEDDILSESDFARFLAAARNVRDSLAFPQIVEDLIRRGRQVALVNRLEQSVDDLPLERPELLLALMFGNGEALDRGGIMGMNAEFLTSWIAAHRYLARLSDSRARREAFTKAFEASHFLAVPATLLTIQQQAFDEPDKKDPPIFDLDDLKALQRLWVDRMAQSANNLDYQLTQPNLLGRLYRWRQFGDVEAPGDWATEIARSRDHVLALLKQFVNRGSSQSINDLVATPIDSFQRENFEAFLPVSVVRNTLSGLPRDTLDVEGRQIIALFERYAQSWDEQDERDRQPQRESEAKDRIPDEDEWEDRKDFDP
jgi:hypothetical protein